jgi:hypothetical protein
LYDFGLKIITMVSSYGILKAFPWTDCMHNSI